MLKVREFRASFNKPRTSYFGKNGITIMLPFDFRPAAPQAIVYVFVFLLFCLAQAAANSTCQGNGTAGKYQI